MKNVSFKLTLKLRGSAAFHISCTSHVSISFDIQFCAFHFAKGHINSCPLDQSPIEQKVEKPEELLRCTGHSLDDIIEGYYYCYCYYCC